MKVSPSVLRVAGAPITDGQRALATLWAHGEFTDSERFHSSPSDRANDARRDARLNQIGFRVIRISDVELDRSPHDALNRVRTARIDADLRRVG